MQWEAAAELSDGEVTKNANIAPETGRRLIQRRTILYFNSNTVNMCIFKKHHSASSQKPLLPRVVLNGEIRLHCVSASVYSVYNGQ